MTGASPEPRRWRPAGFFVLRSPLLAAAEARALAASVGRVRAGGGSPWEALPEEPRAAIALASPELVEGLARASGAAAADRALAAYLLRMGLRPAPFGWLSGVSVGEVGRRTELRLGPRDAHRFHLRLSPPALAALGRRAASALDGRPVRYEPASTLLDAGGEIRLHPTGPDGFWTGISTTPAGAAVRRALEAASGGRTLQEIAAAVLEASQLSPERRAAAEAQIGPFLQSLVEGQILVSEIIPPVTGADPLESLCGAVLRLAAGEAMAAALEALRRDLAEAFRRRPRHAEVAALGARVRSLAGPQAPPHVLDGQLHHAAPGLSLGPAPVAELLEAARCLWRWRRPGPPADLRDFARRFAERFGAAEVPLGVAVDPHLGVGYGRERGWLASPPLLAPVTEEAAAATREEWTEQDRRLAELAAEALAPAVEGRAVLRLPETAGAPDGGEALPAAFTVLATVAAAGGDRVDAGDFRLLAPVLAAGSTAALLARFCHADPALRGRALELARAEAELEAGALLADVALDAPGPRGGIAWRPVLYPFEIPCGGRSGAPADRQLPLSDLLVSVRGGEVRLRSRRHGRPVRIRISCAIDAASPAFPAAYRLLGALAAPRAGGWSWHGLRHWPHLPRVEHRRAVLAPETWNLPRDAAAGPREARRWADELRGRHGLPRRIALVEDGEALPLDLEAPLEAALLRRAFRGGGAVTVVEDLEEDAGLLLQGPEGGYRHQLLVPFLAEAGPAPRERPEPEPERIPAPASAPAAVQPGGPVLYAKLYADPAMLDRLAIAAAGFARGAVARGLARSWHFLKYRDPEPHLRVRLLDVAPEQGGALWAELHAAVAGFRELGRLWRTQPDTYEREVERYGGPDCIAHAEALFAADSGACAAMLEALGRTPGTADARGVMIAASAHALLADLVPALEPRREVLARLEDAYARELRAGREARARLGARFREHRRLLASVVSGDLPEPFSAAIRGRGEAVREAWARYEPALAARGRSAWLLAVQSLVHLNVCRFQGDDVRREELALYGLLRRAVDDLLHRRRRSGANLGP